MPLKENTNPLHVLLIENNQREAARIQKMFSAHCASCQMSTAATVSQGLDTLGNTIVEAILLNPNLPDATGTEALGVIRSAYPALPIIVLSGQDDSSIALAAHHSADAIIKKASMNKARVSRALYFAVVRKKREETLRFNETKYRTFIEQLKEAYFEIDLKGKLQFYNRISEGLYGYSSEELFGMTHRDLTDDKYGQKVFEAYNRIYTTGVPNRSLQYEIIQKNGVPLTIESSVSLMTDDTGRPIGFRGISRDITERKAKELELIQAKKKAKEATRAKSEFLANMSHEIRTPMNGIIGMFTLLQQTDLDTEQADYINTGRHSAERLLVVINDILDYSKIEAGKLDIEATYFNLRSTIDDLVLIPATQAQEKGLEFVHHIDPEVPTLLTGDPGRLRQIILNLTINGVKFTQQGQVALNVTLEHESDTHVRLRFAVQDTGIGIAKDDQARLFKSFQQLDGSHSRKFGGAGLGLVIAWRLTELMGGDMGVDSDAGRGATFWFAIEFAKAARNDDAKLMVPKDICNKRILIVDDNKTNLKILEGHLKLWKCYCDKASNADMALTLMHAMAKAGAPYELVITDMLMPDIDGAELGRRIKADPALNQTLIILLNSQGFRGDCMEMKKIGFSGYLTKPVRPAELFDCILTVFSHHPTVAQKKTPHKLVTRFALSEAKQQDCHILLAEDNPINRKLILHLLERFGFKTNVVQNGKQAVKALEMRSYDLVFMDIQMPELDGFEATRIIRDPDSAVLNHDIPIIAMTARGDNKDRHACLNAGMDDYIAKPIEPDKLLWVIQNWQNSSANRHQSP